MKYINQHRHPDIPYTIGEALNYDWYLYNKEAVDQSNGMSKMKYEPGMKGTPMPVSVKEAGCGLCASIMAADRLLTDYDFTLEDAVQLSYAAHANGGGTDYEQYAPAFAEKLGLELLQTDKLEDVDRCLLTGGAVVAKSGGDRGDYVGVFTHGWHYITIVGKRADGKYIILDPSQEPGKFDEPGREGKVEVSGNILYCTPEVLDKDCEIFKIRYSCFWKK